MTRSQPLEACLWITPKIFDDLTDPVPGIEAFFDHHAAWTDGRPVTVVFCASNGDHVLNYSGDRSARFDWARYNCFAPGEGGPAAPARAHNLDWLVRVREGGERSSNPYSAGPMFTLSEQPMDYHVLAGVYTAIRRVAARRGLEVRLLEYLEPGPEFCRSEWKTLRHPEVSAAAADAGGHVVPGVVDVTLPLAADPRAYAAYPQGFAAGLAAGDFVAAQTAAFVADFDLDGILLGNQFGLVGFWNPRNAPEPTAGRRAGIERFFTRLRAAMGDRLVYWMDTYWRADVEREAWGMSDACYATLDAILVSTFAVLVERTEIVPNVRSKAALDGPRVLFGLDFVDPWYWYRTHLDDRRTYLFQRETLAAEAAYVDGVSFFANDTFGHFVPQAPLAETLAVVRAAD
ncbi:hypothetical protein FHS43_002602 [Streptosporangium becharense]|uniref:Uncharacterized protein n=1 Tax=Streptosporangium becharense TaxID=1816182 RepID=A0A7W9MI41_9ACTN|nr:hypothetical protein [Streptosporangium becharense]MBB2911337.1 hypothetical protein [Streptosporangium becharense]MBB5821605.1 hypothetical protein [Streptosporangium becharense]